MPFRSLDPHPGGRFRGLAWRGLQAHTQGEVEGSGLGEVSRPTPRGEVEGSGLGGVSRPMPVGDFQAHTGGGSPGPHPGGCIPACTETDTPPPQQTATAAGGMHPTGMHSCYVNEFRRWCLHSEYLAVKFKHVCFKMVFFSEFVTKY